GADDIERRVAVRVDDDCGPMRAEVGRSVNCLEKSDMGGSSDCRDPPNSAAMHALRFDTKGATATAAEVTAPERGPLSWRAEQESQPCDTDEFTESDLLWR